MKTLVNGQYSNKISAQDRGLAYGDGLFETIKVKDGIAIHLPAHLNRLIKGCNRLRISCDIDQLKGEINRILDDSPKLTHLSVLKIIITREAIGRTYQTYSYAKSNRVVSLTKLSSEHLSRHIDGVSTVVCETPLAINPALAGLKHLCRLENVIARSEWQSDTIAEGLLLDSQNRLVEGTMSNIFLVKGGQLYTPSLHRCGVDGIIRHHIINLWSVQLGIKVTVLDLTLDNIYSSEEIFVCNSIIGIWPVISVGCHQKKVGYVTRALQKVLNT